MEALLIGVAGCYLFCFVVVILMNPVDQPWLPHVFQEGHRLHWLAPMVLALPVLAAPVLLVVLGIAKVVLWAQGQLYKRRQKRADETAGNIDGSLDTEPEDGLRSVDEVLSASEISMFDMTWYSVSTSHSVSSSSANDSGSDHNLDSTLPRRSPRMAQSGNNDQNTPKTVAVIEEVPSESVSDAGNETVEDPMDNAESSATNNGIGNVVSDAPGASNN